MVLVRDPSLHATSRNRCNGVLVLPRSNIVGVSRDPDLASLERYADGAALHCPLRLVH
jgi:hypothetical protein